MTAVLSGNLAQDSEVHPHLLFGRSENSWRNQSESVTSDPNIVTNTYTSMYVSDVWSLITLKESFKAVTVGLSVVSLSVWINWFLTCTCTQKKPNRFSLLRLIVSLLVLAVCKHVRGTSSQRSDFTVTIDQLLLPADESFHSDLTRMPWNQRVDGWDGDPPSAHLCKELKKDIC